MGEMIYLRGKEMDYYKDEPIQELIKRKRVIEKQIVDIEKRLKESPEGALRIATKQWGYQFYQKIESYDSTGQYIDRNNKTLISQLAQKDYDKRLLPVLIKQLKAIERFLKDYDPRAAIELYDQLKGPRKNLVNPVYPSDEEFVRQWLSMPYKGLGFKNDDPEYYTENNERVRSKSEIIIANTLRSHNIPYRYEYPVYEDGVVIAAPDFNCLNVRTRKEYYWEHLGMMDDEAYVNKNIRKIEKYTLAKGFDESRLILTFETSKQPLNTRIIEEKIRRYLI